LADIILKAANVTTNIVYADSKVVGSIYINVTIDEKIENDEGYFILVDNNYVNVSAKKPAGIYYAFQTLRQLLPVEIESKNVSILKINLLFLDV
jgi:hexosaminidase